jgi:hypothetical protein
LIVVTFVYRMVRQIVTIVRLQPVVYDLHVRQFQVFVHEGGIIRFQFGIF